VTIACVLALSLSAVPAASGPAGEWPGLIQAGELAAAKSRCEGWLNAAELLTRAEGHKCLANVEVGLASRAADDARVEGQGGADEELAGIRRAVGHLDAAIELAPGDLSIHQGRLHLLRMAGLVAEMAKALEDSIRRHPGPDWLHAWKAYPREYYEAQRFEEAVLLYRVLDRYFADDHTILSNMGAALAMLQRDAEALECFQRAVKLSPDDPIDNWNLARLYDFMGKLDEAQSGYERALALKQDDAARANGTCVYAEFLEKKRNDRKRACELQRKASCPTPTACGVVPASR
jgi:tetratricopeptide (TPR) repeat protein